MGWLQESALWVVFTKHLVSGVCRCLYCISHSHITSLLFHYSVSEDNSVNTPCFPQSRNRVRVYIGRYSVWECVKHTHSHAHRSWSSYAPLSDDQRLSSSLSEEISCDPQSVPGLEDVRTHAPVPSILRLPVTSFVHKVCLSCDRVPPLMKPQWLVAFIFPTCGEKHKAMLSCYHLTGLKWRSHICRQFTKQSIFIYSMDLWEAIFFCASILGSPWKAQVTAIVI